MHSFRFHYDYIYLYSTHRYAASFPPKREIVIPQLLRGVLVTLFRELSLYSVDRTASGNNKRKKPRRQRQQHNRQSILQRLKIF